MLGTKLCLKRNKLQSTLKIINNLEMLLMKLTQRINVYIHALIFHAMLPLLNIDKFEDNLSKFKRAINKFAYFKMTNLYFLQLNFD